MYLYLSYYCRYNLNQAKQTLIGTKWNVIAKKYEKVIETKQKFPEIFPMIIDNTALNTLGGVLHRQLRTEMGQIKILEHSTVENSQMHVITYWRN
jgi:hypothetical protein